MRAGIAAVLANGAYRRLFAAQVLALLSTGVLTVALGLLAFERAGAAAGVVLGTALTIKMAAYVFLSPVIVALVHRAPEKAVLIAADLVRLASAAALPFVTEIWQIYALVFVLQAASATFTPTFQSLIPAVLPSATDYTRALALSRVAYDLEALLSPLIAGLLLAIVPFTGLFAATAVGFALSATLVSATVMPAVALPPGAVGFLQRLGGGMAVFLRTPPLRFLLVINVVVAAGTAMVLVNSVVLVKDRAEASDAALAGVLAIFGVGSALAAVVVPRLIVRTPVEAVMFGGAALVLLGLAGAFVGCLLTPVSGWVWAVILPSWAVLGAGTSLITTPSGRLLADASEPTNRSLVFAAQFALSHACFLVTYPLAGWVGAADLAAAAGTLLLIAALAVIALVLWFRPLLIPGWGIVADEQEVL